MEAKFKYWAFISYSHADRKWGDWLHHALETRRIPKALVGQDTQRGEAVPGRVFPVFRDREELPTSANLGAVISEALRESRYLIVICSPHAAASRWVNQEILDYKRLGREDRILALIVDGEPNAGDGKRGYAAEMECFPEALKHPLGPDGGLDRTRHTEPIAADARSDKDGKLNATLKLLAGVLGVNYDDLKRRDEERRRRQQRLVVAASTALALVFASLAGTAVWQWRSAELQTRQALQTLSQSDFLQANHLIADDRRVEALAYLVRSLSADPGNRAASTRMTTLLATHSWMVPLLSLPHAIAQFSPDGRQLAVAAPDHILSVWDLESGEPIATSMKLENDVAEAHFNADGRQFISFSATAGECSLDHWDIRSGTLIKRLSLQACGTPNSVEFSADGKQVAVTIIATTGLAIVASRVKVWDTTDGHLAWTMPAGDEIATSARLSPDGSRIATVSTRNKVRIWDIQAGTSVVLPLQESTGVHSLGFSPDGKRVVTATEYGSQVWDAGTSQPLTGLIESGEETQTAEFSPDGKRLVTASAYEQNGMARVWDASSGRPLTPPMQADSEVYGAHFSPDGRRIVIVSGVTVGRWVTYSTARVWDAVSGQPLTEPLTINTPVETARFSPDGRRLITTAADDTQVWDLREAERAVMTLEGSGTGWHASFSPDGQRIVTAGSAAARIWDAHTGRATADPMKDAKALRDIRFNPDGSQVVGISMADVGALDADTGIYVWDAASGRLSGAPLQLQQSSVAPMPVLSPDTRSVVAITAADPKSAVLFDLKSGQRRATPMSHEYELDLVRFSPDGKWIVTASAEGSARIWAADTGRAVSAPLIHRDNIQAAEFSPDGSLLVTATRGSLVRIWDVQSGRLQAGPFKHGLFGPEVQFSPDGKRIATYSADSTVRLWDAQHGAPLMAPIEAGGEIYAVKFSADGRRLLSVANDQVLVWDSASGQSISDPLPRAGTGAQFDPEGTRIITDSGRVYDLAPVTESPPWLLTLGRAVAGQILDRQGVLEPAPGNNAKVLHEISRDLAHASDDWAAWGRWFLADPATRSVAPFSVMAQQPDSGDRGKAPPPVTH